MIVNGFWFYRSNSSYQLSGPIPTSPQSLRPWTLIERLPSSAALESEQQWGLKVVKRGNALWRITITWRHGKIKKYIFYVFCSLCRTSFSFLSCFHWLSDSGTELVAAVCCQSPAKVQFGEWIVWMKHFSELIQLIHVAEMAPTCKKSAKSQSSVKCADVALVDPMTARQPKVLQTEHLAP